MFAHNPEARSDFELRVLRDKVELYHILRHERGLEYFTRQLEKEYSGENIKFWKETHRYRHNTDPGHLFSEATRIFDEYVSETAGSQVNVKSNVRVAIKKNLQKKKVNPHLFDAARKEIYELMARDNFSRFKQGPLFRKLLDEVQCYKDSMVTIDDVRVMKKHYSANISRSGSSASASQRRSRGVSAAGDLAIRARGRSMSRDETFVGARNGKKKGSSRLAERRTTATGVHMPNTPETSSRKFAHYLANSSVITKGRIEQGIAHTYGGPRSMLQYPADEFGLGEDIDGVKDH